MNIPIHSTNNEACKYDYSKYIKATKSETQYESFSTFIDEKIIKYRKEHYDDVHDFNRAVIAKMIGISTGTLTKIVNGRQATRKRDLIIALCFALKLSKYEADQALSLYPMAPLNPNNLRDLVIIHALYDGVSVEKLNDILEYHHFSKLNVVRCNKKDEDRNFYVPYSSSQYEELSVDIVPYCIAGDDVALSLHSRYDPETYKEYHSTMLIQKTGDNKIKYRITYDGNYNVEQETADGWKCLYSNNCFDQEFLNANECTDEELNIEIEKLKEYTDRKARYIHSMCNDTLYYKYRLNAVNNNGELEIYGEIFGYEHPELHEYFQIEISSSKCKFTKSNGSRFLAKYLKHSEWKKMYGMPVPTETNSYSSLAEIQNKEWRNQFLTLLAHAQELLDQIKERKVFLVNARAFCDIDIIIDIFNVAKEFDCYSTKDSPFNIPHKESFIGPDGKPITIDDLYRAAELDIFSIEDLCAIRSRYGSLERFLHIDILSQTNR
ncbi:MAG: hypothetical protein IJ571_08520 [Ruminococcus sp.]|nr:hypothetical protein [Ruminococcus sp.]